MIHLKPAALLFLCVVAACTQQPEVPRSASTASMPNVATSGPRAPAIDPNRPEFKRGVQSRLDAMEQEELVREEAPWFGRTGLSDAVERELPRYVRREHGKLLSEPGSVKASDLDYVGAFQEGVETVHYWAIHDGTREPAYAYCISAPPGHATLGWGGRRPPR